MTDPSPWLTYYTEISRFLKFSLKKKNAHLSAKILHTATVFVNVTQLYSPCFCQTGLRRLGQLASYASSSSYDRRWFNHQTQLLTALHYFRAWEIKDEQDVTVPPGSCLEIFTTKQTKEMAAIRALTFGGALMRAGKSSDPFLCKEARNVEGKEGSVSLKDRGLMNQSPSYYMAIGKLFPNDS